MRQLVRGTGRSVFSAPRAGDRFGIGFRSELAAEILANLDRIGCVEVLADDWLDRPARDLGAIKLLARSVPVSLHGTGLGLASVEPVNERRLDAWARLIDRVEPAAWSEHVAFVRAGGIEIGHLAAPPRTPAVLDGTIRNLRRAAAIVGSAPLIENVASIVDPPAAAMTEQQFLGAILEATSSDLLLDLHNLHVNATNFTFDPRRFLDALPSGRIRQVHIAGGRLMGTGLRRRLLDDHLHPVPGVVFELLGEVAGIVRQPIWVLLERDGCYPEFGDLLSEIDRARAAVDSGRRTPLTAGAVP